MHLKGFNALKPGNWNERWFNTIVLFNSIFRSHEAFEKFSAKKSEDFSSLLLSDHNFNENYVSQR